jgi:alpha-ketoglutarate-dependent taurine dioxygenase
VPLETREIDGSFAREVVGVRLWERQDPATLEALRDLWAVCGVLVFRRQALTEDELTGFSAAFGQPQIIVRTDWASPNRPEVVIISNLKDANNKGIGGLGLGELEWHTDQSYIADPATGAMLYAVELPREGGGTWWANLNRAYEALPDHLCRAVEGKLGIFSYAKRLSGYQSNDQAVTEDIKRNTPDVTHPLIHCHPVTGRKALYFDPTTTIGVVGMSAEVGAGLLRELTEFATRPEFVYRHRWQIGDVVMWDNGFLLHRRDAFEPSQRRFLKRTTIALPRDRHFVPTGALAAVA